MLIVHPALKIDMFKMEQAFQTSYKEFDKVFYVSPLNWRGEEEFLETYQVSRNGHWRSKNKKFENFLLLDPNLKYLLSHFFVWNGNDMLQA